MVTTLQLDPTRGYRIAKATDGFDESNGPIYLGFGRPDFAESRVANPRLIYPALALAAFIGWKGFWLLRDRRQQH